MLFPQQNAYRTILDLSGFWNFRPDPDDAGKNDAWFSKGLPEETSLIAVPGAWNEQLAESGLKNFVGCGWYETTFMSPRFDKAANRLLLRIGAADHRASVWLNGTPCGFHEGGYLPFEVDLTGVLRAEGASNRLVICVDSRLTMETIPQGIDPDAAPYNGSGYDRRHLFPPTRFDFFPYGGLTRPVQLLLVPASRITSIAVQSSLAGRVHVTVGATGAGAVGSLEVHDGDRGCVALSIDLAFVDGKAVCVVDISNPRLWSPSTPHLYTAVVRLRDSSGKEADRYDQPFGIREVAIKEGTLLLNGEPLYLAGFGKHEDFPIVGRGQFRPAYLRDFELMRWAGANSFRTSHYPYDEEVLHLADRLGFLVIDEVAAVSLGFPSDRFEDLTPLLDVHRRTLTDLIERDRNHPSVVAWSPMNEPNLWSEPHYQNDASRRYFRAIFDHVRSLDATRPTIAITMGVFSAEDVALEACDMIGINRYFGWYTEPGDLARARASLEKEMDALHERYGRPIMITECGVDTMEGYHATTAQMFTEEYQIEFLRTYASVADRKPFCAGFHVWNFADFLTPQHYRRVVLNKKGVFTRERNPKGAAFFLREHWRSLTRIRANHRPKGQSGSFLVEDVKPSGT